MSLWSEDCSKALLFQLQHCEGQASSGLAEAAAATAAASSLRYGSRQHLTLPCARQTGGSADWQECGQGV